MALFLVVFQHEDRLGNVEDRGIHLTADSFEEAVEMVDALRKTAQVEGLVWDQTTGSRGRLN